MMSRPARAKIGIALAVLCAVALAATSLARKTSYLKHHEHKAERRVDPLTSCGPVSLSVVSRILGRPVSIEEFHAATGAGDLGYCTVADLLRALRQHGFAATAIRYDPRRPPSSPRPMILHLDEHHFLTALSRPNGEIILVDPPSEPEVVDWSTLRDRWEGVAVVVGLADGPSSLPDPLVEK